MQLQIRVDKMKLLLHRIFFTNNPFNTENNADKNAEINA